jgi:hypothetical protein
MLQVIIRAKGLKKDTSMGAKHRRHVPNSILWFIVLTFPIWLFWFGALTVEATTHAPIEIYFVLIPASYYAIFAYVPYIGFPWVMVVIFFAIFEFRKRRALRRSIRVEKKRTVPEDASAGSSKAKSKR